MALFSLVAPNQVSIPQPDTSWIGNLAGSVTQGLEKRAENASFGRLADTIAGTTSAAPQPGFFGRLMGQTAIPASGAQNELAASSPAPKANIGTPNDIENGFLSTVKAGGLTNPYGLAAVAATGRAESGWSPQNAGRTWNDGANDAGGILSWNGPRLAALRAANGGSNGTPEQQAKFFLAEDPELIQKLNNAQSPQEASSIMANAWRFRGYDQPGGEAARRQALTQNYYSTQFANSSPADATASAAPSAPAPYRDPVVSAPNFQGPSTQVASLDPSIGIPLPGAAGQMRATDPTADRGSLTTANTAPVAAPVQASGAPSANPPVNAPVQTAQNNGPGILAAGITPVTRNSFSNQQIAELVRDPNTRQVGLGLWQQVLGKSSAEPWQFVQLPDGTLARANQATGEVQSVGRFSKPEAPVSVGEGSTLIDPTSGRVVYQGQGKPPTIQEFYDPQSGQSYKAQWNPQTSQWDKVGGTKANAGETITTNPDGTVTISKGVPGQPPKLTEDQGKSSGFFLRATTAEKDLGALEGQGTSIWNNTGGKLPVVGNYMRSQDAQKYDQAKRNFINAVLRRESGAVIGPSEFDNAEQQYFPQPGDGPDVIKQKKANRADAIKGLEIGAGPGAGLAVPPPAQGGGGGKTSSGVQWSIEQ